MTPPASSHDPFLLQEPAAIVAVAPEQAPRPRHESAPISPLTPWQTNLEGVVVMLGSPMQDRAPILAPVSVLHAPFPMQLAAPTRPTAALQVPSPKQADAPIVAVAFRQEDTWIQAPAPTVMPSPKRMTGAAVGGGVDGVPPIPRQSSGPVHIPAAIFAVENWHERSPVQEPAAMVPEAPTQESTFVQEPAPIRDTVRLPHDLAAVQEPAPIDTLVAWKQAPSPIHEPAPIMPCAKVQVPAVSPSLPMHDPAPTKTSFDTVLVVPWGALQEPGTVQVPAAMGPEA